MAELEKVGIRINRFENGITDIRGIPDDMGSDAKLDILVEEDGDVVLTLRSTNIEDVIRRARAGVGQEITIQFCTRTGGGHNTLITRKLRELAILIAEDGRRND